MRTLNGDSSQTKDVIHQNDEQQAKLDLIKQVKRIMNITKRKRFYQFIWLVIIVWFVIIPLVNHLLTGQWSWQLWGTYQGHRVSIIPYHTSRELYVFTFILYSLVIFAPIVAFVHTLRRRTQLEADDATYLAKILKSKKVGQIPVVTVIEKNKDRTVNIHYLNITKPVTLYRINGRSGYYQAYHDGYKRIITSKHGCVTDLTHITHSLLPVLPNVEIKDAKIEDIYKKSK